MLNPPNFHSGSGSDIDLLRRMTRRVRQKKVDDQILAIMQQVFETELNVESVVLSRPERVRLFRQITKTVLTEILEKINDAA
jgi:hypothetical protein